MVKGEPPITTFSSPTSPSGTTNMARSKKELLKEAEELGVEAPEDYQELRSVVDEARDTEGNKKEEKTDRQIRWENLLERYKAQSPEKYKIKKERGEFNKIPDSFK